MLKKLTVSIITFVLTLSFISVAFAESRASGEINVINYDYSEQFMSDWCWAATGVNLFIGSTGECDNMSSSEKKELLYQQVKECVDNSDHLVPNKNYSDKYDKYNVGAGLSDTCTIVNNLLYENRYRDVEYDFSPKTRSFRWIADDIKNGYPLGIYLDSTGSIVDYDHIVMINGTDTIFDTSEDYEIRIFNSDTDRNVWINYEDAKSGNSKDLKYRTYVSTAEAYY